MMAKTIVMDFGFIVYIPSKNSIKKSNYFLMKFVRKLYLNLNTLIECTVKK